MTQEIKRIEIDLVPLNSRRISEGWTMVPGYPLQMPPDCQSAPNIGSEALLMMFSVMRSNAPLGGQALHARTSAVTLYVPGTLFGLFCYWQELDRLVKAIEEPSPTIH
ncbi:hypothetical protein B5P46_21645 [Rhizobium leguminosarum]|uniref:Uncharacterized protein n=1 Tax=Rhizobium leguminosarum TaxID=384 RepID=A0A4V1P120_RHILE|nr:hypothetical protein [Rhizobium leguminosarum]RXT22490.1 hypothetical protein B5P46_21645 [Rhizobium leguminosarum]